VEALAAPGALGAGAPLPEVARVYWRPRVDEARLRRAERTWTLATWAHVIPLTLTAAVLAMLSPVAIPIALITLAKAWYIPSLYTARGANVMRPRPRAGAREERTALGLLGDLVGHEARDLHAKTGVVLERARFGVWLVGEAGALLVRPGGRLVHCYCVKATDPSLPSADRIAHLLLALREDEAGFATVANRAFAGARWRVRRRLPAAMRPALDRAGEVAAAPR
jgi:hypothetical protein